MNEDFNMKWQIVRPSHDDVKVSWKFILLPHTMQNQHGGWETRFLEFSQVVEKYDSVMDKWRWISWGN